MKLTPRRIALCAGFAGLLAACQASTISNPDPTSSEPTLLQYWLWLPMIGWFQTWTMEPFHPPEGTPGIFEHLWTLASAHWPWLGVLLPVFPKVRDNLKAIVARGVPVFQRFQALAAATPAAIVVHSPPAAKEIEAERLAVAAKEAKTAKSRSAH